MTNKEYLNQAHYLKAQIDSLKSEVDELRQLSTSIGSPALGDRVDGTRPRDASFVKTVMRIMEMESRIDHYVDLKSEITHAIEAVDDPEEQILLKYRYINGYNWYEVSSLMCVSLRTVHRIHASALNNFRIPV